MTEYDVSFSTTTYGYERVTVEADSIDEASDIAYDQVMWQYDEIEINHVEEI